MRQTALAAALFMLAACSGSPPAPSTAARTESASIITAFFDSWPHSV